MIGKLDRRITFIQPIYETGTSNENKIIGWETISSNDTVWAQKLERSGNTFVQDDRITFARQTDWGIRYRTDLTVEMRLVFETLVYAIVNIAELTDKMSTRKRYLRLNTTLIDNEYFT